MVDVAAIVWPMGAPLLELFPCLGLAILGVALGRPSPPPDPDSPCAMQAQAPADSPWTPPRDP